MSHVQYSIESVCPMRVQPLTTSVIAKMAPTRAKRTLAAAFGATEHRSTRSQRSKTTKPSTTEAPRKSINGKARRRPPQAQDSIQSDDACSDSDEDDMYEVEAIIKEKDGRFFVKWTGYDTGDSTWEPECNLKPQMTSSPSSGDSSLIGAHVVVLPSEEEWMPATDYRCVGSAYLTSVIAREYVEKGKKKPSRANPLYELRWTTSQF
ncbi:hypothetical protein PHYSODRAFT_297582 [Phytophthora sojae]|uniref:Chromo domain-containing protein n=1 Tax=Phytophthora sojae (strain P6497) TaxID=1094619 RepID=G4YYV6_PHYSP|nr:hypothetical protein PHYSODRAFT_297582 [Phytophthora sojae]EGZ26248.1 hypothetical protein PHYSODRAFT_297582 [Phytophthora sojae]|eukprot:XP_009521536.1 hypothetical protein PHYSODRAFT_297582 [Phytophthora sojae]